MTKLSIKSILVYSEKNDSYFHSDFDKKLNVIYGKNTAGKSTLIQLILYAFGINDNKVKLTEILQEEIFVRIDCVIHYGEAAKRLVFLRQDETLFIKEDERVLRFNGIGSDNSYEHIKLKDYFHKLFDFSLTLESAKGMTPAPIETIFLPYYVSQDVGWVYLRKSFSNLNFYKNFKEDFLDYYLGIENFEDRTRKRELEKEVQALKEKIKFLQNIEKENTDVKVSEVIDSSFSGKANEFVDRISNDKGQLIEWEKEYIKESNSLSFFNQRLSVISIVKRNQKKQMPGEFSCPTCTQVLPRNLEGIYDYKQKQNDNIKLEKELKNKVKSLQSKINGLSKKIETLRGKLRDEHDTFNRYSNDNITAEAWIENKANLRLYKNLVTQIGELNIELDKRKYELAEYKTEEQVISARRVKSSIFKKIYQEYNSFLSLPKLEEGRFSDIYSISGFPYQGVQLHLAVLSYHFAFNNMLTKSQGIHRLPFILDSVFKEDIDGGEKLKILKFIKAYYPKDTQTILSIADDKHIDSKINEYSENIFKEDAHLICIGGGENKKALLQPNDGLETDLIQDSYEIMEVI